MVPENIQTFITNSFLENKTDLEFLCKSKLPNRTITKTMHRNGNSAKLQYNLFILFCFNKFCLH